MILWNSTGNEVKIGIRKGYWKVVQGGSIVGYFDAVEVKETVGDTGTVSVLGNDTRFLFSAVGIEVNKENIIKVLDISEDLKETQNLLNYDFIKKGTQGDESL